MHSIYHNDGLIIDSRPYGEADSLLWIFTGDFGLVRALARGIRLHKSKLRGRAQKYHLGSYSFVRGREFWRLTDARDRAGSTGPETDGYAVSPRSRTIRDFAARLSLLLRRLLHGEEAQPVAFLAVTSALDFASGDAAFCMEDLESLTVLRVLHALGYVDSAGVGQYCSSAEISTVLLESVRRDRRELNRRINHALRESHL